MFVSSPIADSTELSGLRSASEERRRERPLTVLQIIPKMETAEDARGTIEVTEAITREGGRAIVAAAGGRMLPRATKAGGEVVAMNLDTTNPLNLWQNARLMARLIRDLEVDIVHALSRAPAWSAHAAAKRTGAHFITTYQRIYPEDVPLKRHYNGIMARGQPVIAVSNHIRNLIVRRHRVLPDRIITIPRGADINVFSEETVGNERAVKLADQWGLLDDARPVVLVPPPTVPGTGAADMIAAAQRLKAQRGNDFVVLLTGEDPGDGKDLPLSKRVDQAEVGDVVRLTGGCTDLAAAYKLASVVVSCSTEPEAFCRPIIEAQAMGRPVIATDHGGARETVSHGESGWLYPPGDVERLSIELGKALDLDPSERAHMGMAARARIHARYTVSATQRATLDVYEQVAGRTFATLV